MVIVIGKIRASSGQEAVVERAVERVIAQTANEAGVVEYSFFQDSQDRRSFTILEVWDEADALAAHSSSEHLAEFRATVYPALEHRDVRVYDAEPRTRHG
jgi:quinol monooxygenase YgiN